MKISWRFIMALMLAASSQVLFAAEPYTSKTAVSPAVSTTVTAADIKETSSSKTSGLKWSPDGLSIAATPLSYAFVRGDKDRYRQMEWRNDGAVWGASEYTLTEGDLEDVYMELKGHDMIRNGDYGNEVLLSKKGLGFLEFNFDQYRKYFDGTGGVLPGFSRYHVIELDRDLYLDIGKIEVEAGLRMEDLPEVTFKYEHEYKKGAKSRLTWASVIEGGWTRKISPSWQELDEEVNAFDLEGKHEIGGYEVEVEQRFEDISTNSRRYEKNYSVNPTLSQKVIRVQDQEPDSYYSGTGLRVGKWFWGDKVHSSGGYHFQYVKTTEWENLKDYDENMAAYCSSANCENKSGAFSSAQNDIQDFVWNAEYFPTPHINTGLKLKAGFEQRHAHSDYPGDYTAPNPDNIIDRIDSSYTTDQRHSLAQAISFRYTGIPNTSLYTDLSLEQRRSWISEERESFGVQGAPNGNESWQRETIWNPRTEAWTAGVNYSPDYRFTLVPQIRLYQSAQDYDDKRETAGSVARSAFIDKMKYDMAEFTLRTMVRPTEWLQTGFKYMVQDGVVASRAENELVQKSNLLNDSYTFDTYLYPRSDLSFSSVVTLYNSALRVPTANRSGTFGTGKSDVASWMVGADYIPLKDLTIHQDIYYSWANNYQDLSVVGLPYGAAFNRVGYTIRFDWTRFKNWKLGPLYSFSHYGPNPDYDAGRYTAHLLGMDIAYAWE